MIDCQVERERQVRLNDESVRGEGFSVKQRAVTRRASELITDLYGSNWCSYQFPKTGLCILSNTHNRESAEEALIDLQNKNKFGIFLVDNIFSFLSDQVIPRVALPLSMFASGRYFMITFTYTTQRQMPHLGLQLHCAKHGYPWLNRPQ